MSTEKKSMPYGSYTCPVVPLHRTQAQSRRVSSSLGKVRFEGVQDHPRMHVLRLEGMAGVGPARGRGDQAYQVCVSDVQPSNTARNLNKSAALNRWEHGITTFDTADVRCSLTLGL